MTASVVAVACAVLLVAGSTPALAEARKQVTAAAEVTVAGAFQPLPPARILDTRSANGVATTTPVPSQGSVDLQVTGRGGVPASGVAAVVLNVTVTQPTWNGYVTVFPAGSARPTASNLNFAQGQTIPNLVTVKVGTGGKVTLFNGQIAGNSLHLVADVAGYYLDGTPTEPGTFASLSPSRILDTRNGTGGPTGPVAAGAHRDVAVAGQGGVPGTGVSAVVMNVTATQPTWDGYVTAYPSGQTAPLASNLNFVQGQTVPNLVIVALGSDGAVALKNGSTTGTVHLVADLAGYFLDGPASSTSVRDLEVDGLTPAGITLRWTNPPVSGFSGVMIRRAQGSTPPSSPTDGVLAAQTSGAVDVWSDTGVAAAATYSYALFAQTAAGSAVPATITATVPTRPSLTGTVTGPAGAVSGATVHVVGANGLEAAHATTAADGTYSVAGLAPGSYTVCFGPDGGSPGPDGLGHLPQCWNNVGPGGTPTAVAVTAGATVTGIDAHLGTAASVSGTVTNGSGDPVPGVAVTVSAAGGEPVKYALTDDLGHWSVAGLATGSYGVCFDPSGVTSAQYAPECFDGKSPTTSPTLVNVTAGSTRTGVGATLQAVAAPRPGRAGTASAAGPPTETSSQNLAAVACADVLFLAARGSGESGPGGVRHDPGDPYAGIGGPVYTAYEAFVAAVTDGRIVTRPVSVSYPADPVWPPGALLSGSYIPDLWQGVQEARNALTQRATQCPNERIVLAGYSQGAMVMHRVLTNATTDGVGGLAASIRQRIDAAVLLADGDRVAGDTTRDFGTAKATAQGIGTQLDVTVSPAKLSPAVGVGAFSMCDAGDVVCDFRVPDLCAPCAIASDADGFSTHLSYTGAQVVKDTAAAAAAWAQTVPAVGGTPLRITGAAGAPVNIQLEATYSTRYVDGVSWAVAPGSALPPGLSLSATGLVSGVPTTEVSTETISLRLTTTILGVAGTITVQATVRIGALPLAKLDWGPRTPADPTSGQPTAISCPAPGSCLALDEAGQLISYRAGAWSVAASIEPQVSDPGHPSCAHLIGSCYAPLVCTSETFCVAGQALYNDEYVQLSDGGWTRHTIPADPEAGAGGSIGGIGCTSSEYCVFTDTAGRADLLDHGSWSTGPGLQVSGSTYPVSCAAGTEFCMVVAGGGYAYAANGVWSPLQPLPQEMEQYRSWLNCQSATSCILVNGNGALFTWDGTSWSAGPALTGLTYPSVVRCTSTTWCMATGLSGSSVVSVRFNGTAWSQPVTIGTDTPSRLTGGTGGVADLSCVGTFCAAVTYSGSGAAYEQGAWSALTPVVGEHAFQAVSCSSSNFCALVDLAGYAATFDGHTWSAPVEVAKGAIADAQGYSYQPYSISCPVDGWCMAATFQGSTFTYANGTWSALSPHGTVGYSVEGLSCVTTTFCVATGDYRKTLYTYDGSTWTPFSYGTGASAWVTVVSCTSTTFCMVTAGDQALAYDGHTWTDVPIEADDAYFYAISCSSRSFCAAYGYEGEDSSVAYFDGYRWRRFAFAFPGYAFFPGYPAAISCPADGDCLITTGSGTAYTFDGTSLVQIGTLEPGIGVVGLSCVSESRCQAIDGLGYSFTGSPAG